VSQGMVQIHHRSTTTTAPQSHTKTRCGITEIGETTTGVSTPTRTAGNKAAAKSMDRIPTGQDDMDLRSRGEERSFGAYQGRKISIQVRQMDGSPVRPHSWEKVGEEPRNAWARGEGRCSDVRWTDWADRRKGGTLLCVSQNKGVTGVIDFFLGFLVNLFFLVLFWYARNKTWSGFSIILPAEFWGFFYIF
jgi:hypothetical protein